jgi:triacylglycerol lipase
MRTFVFRRRQAFEPASTAALIGRIGGLAVAAGLGAAAVTWCSSGLAWADATSQSPSPSESSSAQSSASPTPSTKSTKKPKPAATSHVASTSGPPVEHATTEDTSVSSPPSSGAGRGEGSVLRLATRDSRRTEPASIGSNGLPTSLASTAAPDSKRTPNALSLKMIDAAPVVADTTRPSTTPSPKSASIVTDTAAILSPFSSNGPAAPVEPPAQWTALAVARREPESASSAESPTTAAAATNPSILSAAALSSAAPSTPSLYTGQPSLVEQVVVAGLRLVDTVLKPLGIQSILALTSLQVPIFTDGIPPGFLTLGLNVQRSEFDGMPVYTFQAPGSTSQQDIVALHGGGYTGQISIFHWWTYADIARDTGATVIVPVYPVAPQGTAGVVVPETADLLSQLIAERGADNVSVLGDSAGGGLALAAVQELVRRGAATPGRMVLLAPWLDATVSDPASQTIADPLLDVADLQSDGRLWAGNLDPANPLVSPINGSLSGLPPTWVYSGSLDLLSPETLRLRDLALAQGDTNFTFILRNGEIHDWDTFPFLPEAQADLPAIEGELLGTDV